MKVLVLMGSPRRKGNTATLLVPFLEALRQQGHDVACIALHGKDLRGCAECFGCQKVMDAPGCGIRDGMQELFPRILEAELLVWATPVFTWFCTPEMKAVLDRLFCLSKTYNALPEKPRLLAGKRLALISTYGDVPATGPDLFEAALRRECAYAGMTFLGHLGVREVHGAVDFSSPEAVSAAKAFAGAVGKGRSMDRFVP